MAALKIITDFEHTTDNGRFAILMRLPKGEMEQVEDVLGKRRPAPPMGDVRAEIRDSEDRTTAFLLDWFRRFSETGKYPKVTIQEAP